MKKKKKEKWMKKDENLNQKGEEVGYYANIAQEFQMQDTNGFKEIMRMNFEHFKEIINLIELDIMPQEIVGGNKVISAAERLTIRFLALGESFGLLSFQFRISNRAASYAIKSVCNALVKYLVPLYLRVKSTKEE